MREHEHVIHGGVGAASCRSCKTPIVFARMASSGKMSPFEHDHQGEWSLLNGVATHVGRAPELAIPGVETVQRWTSHFARCPAGSSWRKR